MKFRQMILTDFMRYKGENVITFSCDPEKNVTVIKGDNTFGKTTLAQAFRWGLYGELIDTRYGKSKEIVLLNMDVVADMDETSTQSVSVVIEIEDVDIIQFKREAVYCRIYPSLDIRKVDEILWMRQKEKDEMWGDWIKNDNKGVSVEGPVSDRINTLLPNELSSYFLFDGENWSDVRKAKAEIKKSLNTLMGITPLTRMKEHLYNGNSSSVIKIFNNSIVGAGTEYEETKRKIKSNEESIEKWEKERNEARENADAFHKKVEAAQAILDSNTKVEGYQKEYRSLERSILVEEKSLEESYADFAKEFSRSAYKYFGAPLLERVIEVLKDVKLEGKDIPDITADTLDYLLENGICICGNKIGEKEKESFKDLKKVIFPNVIGSYVGQYQNKLEEWKLETEDFYSSMTQKAERMEGTKAQKEEDEDRRNNLEVLIDGKINFALERTKMNANRENERIQIENIAKRELWINQSSEALFQLRGKLAEETAHSIENRRTQRMIQYAQGLYDMVSDVLKKRQDPLFDELNAIIKDNFTSMFHEQEKFAQIGEDYQLHLYYKDVLDEQGEPKEEKILSEGEIIARNFVYIVSVLELAEKKKQESLDDDISNLPLVLDGPFSKLGDTNIALVARVLPKAAEQVIVFMLDKDWDASGLGAYTLPEYRYAVKKDINGKSSTIERS